MGVYSKCISNLSLLEKSQIISLFFFSSRTISQYTKDLCLLSVGTLERWNVQNVSPHAGRLKTTYTTRLQQFSGMEPTELTTTCSAGIVSAFGQDVNCHHCGILCWHPQLLLPLPIRGIGSNATGASGCLFLVKEEMVHPVPFPSWWFIFHNFLWGSVRGLLWTHLHHWVR